MGSKTVGKYVGEKIKYGAIGSLVGLPFIGYGILSGNLGVAKFGGLVSAIGALSYAFEPEISYVFYKTSSFVDDTMESICECIKKIML